MTKIDDPDEELVSAAQNGDKDALEVLLKNHYEKIWSICRRMMQNEADALDATQESLITVATRIEKFKGISKFSTWVYRVTTNTCLDELRKKSRRPLLNFDSQETDQPSITQVESSVVDKIFIDEALNELPAEFKSVLILRDVCDLDYAEISETLDIPIGTVRSRISRGRVAINNYLTKGNQFDSWEGQTE